MILDRIVASKRDELAACKAKAPLDDLKRATRDAAPARDVLAALSGPAGHAVRLIAEFKRASPSKGAIRPDLAPEDVARMYEKGGASAMSVLTDGPFFSGSLDDFRTVRGAIDLPLLRKDFTLAAYHVYEARAAGADAVLLIAAILDAVQLRELRELAEELGMNALVEVHNEAELELALGSEPKIVGVNNRDLKTFTVDIETTFRLKAGIPEGVVTVSESGIKTRDDVERLHQGAVDAMLVGETLMRRPNPGDAVRELLGG